MKGFCLAQKMYAALFILVIGFYSATNIYTQHHTLFKAVAALPRPQTPKELKKYVAGVEGAVNTNIIWKNNYIDSYSYLQVLMGKEENDGFDIVKSRQGSLIYGNFYNKVPDDIDVYARRIWRLRESVADTGCEVMFLNPPQLAVKGYTTYSKGIPCYDQNLDQDAMLYYLQSYGIDYMDARLTLVEQGLPLDQHMFKTDHHWTIQAAFYTSQALIGELNERFDAKLDPDDFYRNKNNYNFNVYKNSFLGSLGRRSGMPFSGLDDFTFIWPKFDTDFRWEGNDHDKGVVKRDGPFEKSLIVPYALTTDDPYNKGMYAAYMGGTNSLVKIQNKKSPDGPKLLLIQDSFSIPMATFLAPVFGEVHMIWPLSEDEKVDIDKYVRDNKFDYIIVELYNGNFTNAGFNFFVEPLEGEI